MKRDKNETIRFSAKKQTNPALNYRSCHFFFLLKLIFLISWKIARTQPDDKIKDQTFSEEEKKPKTEKRFNIFFKFMIDLYLLASLVLTDSRMKIDFLFHVVYISLRCCVDEKSHWIERHLQPIENHIQNARNTCAIMLYYR